MMRQTLQSAQLPSSIAVQSTTSGNDTRFARVSGHRRTSRIRLLNLLSSKNPSLEIQV